MAMDLHAAARSGDVAAVRRLVADVEEPREHGMTPLHWAAGFGRVEPVKVLVELGAGKEAKRDDRSTPLHDAAREGHVAAMRLLVVPGADMEAKDAREVTPLHLDCKIRARGGHLRAGGTGS